jgi:hypothetical protein
MLTTKSSYKMIALGLLLTFISPQTLLCGQVAILEVKIIEAPVQMKWLIPAEEVTYVHRGWYEKFENTFKETSVTGKGPLWAQIATSIAFSKTECGELMFGFKIKL